MLDKVGSSLTPRQRTVIWVRKKWAVRWEEARRECQALSPGLDLLNYLDKDGIDMLAEQLSTLDGRGTEDVNSYFVGARVNYVATANGDPSTQLQWFKKQNRKKIPVDLSLFAPGSQPPTNEGDNIEVKLKLDGTGGLMESFLGQGYLCACSSFSCGQPFCTTGPCESQPSSDVRDKSRNGGPKFPPNYTPWKFPTNYSPSKFSPNHPSSFPSWLHKYI